MALTRKMLAAMDIPAEKIDEIINAHTETVNALKEERDNAKSEVDELKKQAGNVEEVQKELDDTKKELEKIKGDDWEKKYNDVKAEYDNFKKDTDAKATKAAKEKAYRKLLADAGISDKRIDSVIKVSGSNIDELKLDKDGNIEEADKIIESVKKEWADFITTTGQRGADVSNPPANNGNGNTGKISRAAELAAKFNSEHYGNSNSTKEE